MASSCSIPCFWEPGTPMSSWLVISELKQVFCLYQVYRSRSRYSISFSTLRFIRSVVEIASPLLMYHEMMGYLRSKLQISINFSNTTALTTASVLDKATAFIRFGLQLLFVVCGLRRRSTWSRVDRVQTTNVFIYRAVLKVGLSFPRLHELSCGAKRSNLGPTINAALYV